MQTLELKCRERLEIHETESARNSSYGCKVILKCGEDLKYLKISTPPNSKLGRINALKIANFVATDQTDSNLRQKLRMRVPE
jgi:hypothetical protein